MSIFGSIKSCSLANVLFKVNTKAGNNIKLDSIPNSKVKEIKPPSAIVPPKLDKHENRKPEEQHDGSIEHTQTGIVESGINRFADFPVVFLQFLRYCDRNRTVSSTESPKAIPKTSIVEGFKGMLKKPMIPAVSNNGNRLGMIETKIILNERNNQSD